MTKPLVFGISALIALIFIFAGWGAISKMVGSPMDRAESRIAELNAEVDAIKSRGYAQQEAEHAEEVVGARTEVEVATTEAMAPYARQVALARVRAELLGTYVAAGSEALLRFSAVLLLLSAAIGGSVLFVGRAVTNLRTHLIRSAKEAELPPAMQIGRWTGFVFPGRNVVTHELLPGSLHVIPNDPQLPSTVNEASLPAHLAAIEAQTGAGSHLGNEVREGVRTLALRALTEGLGSGTAGSRQPGSSAVTPDIITGAAAEEVRRLLQDRG